MRILLISTMILVSSTLALAETVLVSVEPIVIKITPDDSCYLQWVAPDERENGDDLPLEEIGSYTIYAGQESGVYTKQVEVIGDTEIACQALDITEPGDWFFAGITTDTNGQHSKLSNEIIKSVNPINRPVKFIFSGEIIVQ